MKWKFNLSRVLPSSKRPTVSVVLTDNDWNLDIKSFLNKIYSSLSDEGAAATNIELSGVDSVSPFHLLLLFAMKNIYEKKGVPLALIIKEEADFYKFMLETGIAKAFGCLPHGKKSTSRGIGSQHQLSIVNSTVFLTGKTISSYSSMAESAVRDLLNHYDVKYNIIDALDEILRNVGQHSGFKDFYLITHLDKDNKLFKFAVYDDGIGIRTHLSKKPYDEMHPIFRKQVSRTAYNEMTNSHKKSIELAIIDGISGTDYSVNSGAGLNFLLNEVCACCGTVFLYSGNGFLEWKNRQKNLFKVKSTIDGTLIAGSIELR